jgi:hypothetical protein
LKTSLYIMCHAHLVFSIIWIVMQLVYFRGVHIFAGLRHYFYFTALYAFFLSIHLNNDHVRIYHKLAIVRYLQ